MYIEVLSFQTCSTRTVAKIYSHITSTVSSLKIPLISIIFRWHIPDLVIDLQQLRPGG